MTAAQSHNRDRASPSSVHLRPEGGRRTGSMTGESWID
jgi:hypothetical protein